MKKDFLEKLDPTLVRAFKEFLKTYDISESMFKSAIYRLYGRSPSTLTVRKVNKILLRFELKLLFDFITASESDDYGSVTFSTYKMFNRMLPHLYKASKQNSVFELNISNFTILSKLSTKSMIKILLEILNEKKLVLFEEKDRERPTESIMLSTEPVVVSHRIQSRGPRIIKFLKYVRDGWTPIWEQKAALNGSLLDLDREYPPSPFAE